MADAFSGFAYSFFGTLAILMLGRLFIFASKLPRGWNNPRRAWSEANVFRFNDDGSPAIEDRLRAREQHCWEREDSQGGILLTTISADQNPPMPVAQTGSNPADVPGARLESSLM